MAESTEVHVQPDFEVMELSFDDLLVGNVRLDDSLPVDDSDDVLGLHAEEDPNEDLLGIDSSDAALEQSDLDHAIRLYEHEAIAVILRLSTSPSAADLQDIFNSEPTEKPPTPDKTSDNYTTTETTTKDDAEITDEIDFDIDDTGYDSNDSGRWSTGVNVPDDAKWCMSHVPDWESSFNAWCSVHHGQAFHRMLPHCVVQCTTCLATFSLTSDGFWYSLN